MPITTPPTITAMPSPPDPNNRATYNTLAYPWSVAQQTLATEVGAVAANVYGNAQEAQAQADLATVNGAAQVALAAAQASNAASSAADANTAKLAAQAAQAAAEGVISALPDGTVNDSTVTLTDTWSSSKISAELAALDGEKQDVLVSGTNIKTLGGVSLLGSGDIPSGSGLVRSARASNTALGTADKGTLIDITSGTFTQTFDAAATLGDGWWCYLRNSGTGDITLDPNASETIDGLASYVMYPGEVRLVQCDGSVLRSVVLNAFRNVWVSSGPIVWPPGYQRYGYCLWAAGGSGSVGNSGGGGGACAVGELDAAQVSAGGSTTITIGAGGAAVTGATGNAGGDSSIGGFVTSKGGAGGSVSLAFGGDAFGVSTTGSTGGVISPNGSTFYGGGAGGFDAAAGGKTVYGGGGGGKAALGTVSIYGGAGGINGAAGTAPGGGGGGIASGTSGAGARGEMRIWGVI